MCFTLQTQNKIKMDSIDLTGSTLDVENDHASDGTKKTHVSALAQLMIYIFDNNQRTKVESISFCYLLL